jgi:hypothetical protein
MNLKSRHMGRREFAYGELMKSFRQPLPVALPVDRTAKFRVPELPEGANFFATK